MKLGAFMDPEYPIFSTTLCYLERDDAYLMLHRVKKEDDYNHDKWIGVGGKFERFESPEDCLLREVKEETGLTLTTFFRFFPAVCTGGIHETNDRTMEFLRLFHKAQRFPIAFRHRAAEIAANSFLQITTTFNANECDRNIPQITDTANDGRVICVFPVTMKFCSFCKQIFDIGTGSGTILGSCSL